LRSTGIWGRHIKPEEIHHDEREPADHRRLLG
jgi:hypothetical protein